MIPRRIPAPIALVPLLASTLLVAAGPAAAITVDGQLDAVYPAPLVVQTTQTGLGTGQIAGDNNLGDLTFANGSELDAVHVVVIQDELHLFFAGNLALRLNANQNGTVGHELDFFIDSQPAGQNTLNGLGAGHPLNGLTFDAGFEADYWFQFRGDGDQFGIEWPAVYGTLGTPGGGSFANLGSSTAGGPGTLVGGNNPFGMRATIDNRNIAGVTFGCDASSGAGVTRGVEWSIPLAAIGSPTGCFRVTAIIRDPNNTQSPVSNQVLGPVPPGTCPPGPVATLDLGAIAGDQFFTSCPAPVDVPGGAAAPASKLALALAGANPARGDGLFFIYDLPDARPARLQLFDGAGRVVRSRDVGDGAAGPGRADLSSGRPLPAGLYWARLTHGGARVVRRICLLP